MYAHQRESSYRLWLMSSQQTIALWSSRTVSCLSPPWGQIQLSQMIHQLEAARSKFKSHLRLPACFPSSRFINTSNTLGLAVWQATSEDTALYSSFSMPSSREILYAWLFVPATIVSVDILEALWKPTHDPQNWQGRWPPSSFRLIST